MCSFKLVTLVYICYIEFNFAHLVPRLRVTEPVSFLQQELQKECGILSSELEIAPRILRGDDAHSGQYPWIVPLFLSYELLMKNEPDCGGAIISDRYVLTAAHCLIKQYGITVKWVRVGELDLQDGKYVKNIEVDKHIAHEEYNFPLNDIGLLRLVERININDHVRPICLPFSETFLNMNFDGTSMEMAGWGRTLSGIHPHMLQTVTVPIVSTRECQRYIPNLDTRNTLCAGGEVNGVNKVVCDGDSGGPLMKDFPINGRKTYFLFGTVSYILSENRYSYCDVKNPSVCMKITQYLDWIVNNMIQ